MIFFMRKNVVATKKIIKKFIPKRKKGANKYTAGVAIIIGGGKGLYGAGIMSALSASRSGAGYIHLLTDLSRFPWLKYPDFIVHPMSVSTLKKMPDGAIGFGPGVGVNLRGQKIFDWLVKNKTKVVLDADGLTLLSKKNQKLPSEWVLTPHEGELARLMQTSSQMIKKNRVAWINLAQEKYGCVVLLKGAETLITDGNKFMVSKFGSVALAKAGTGDVLTGLITALMAQGIPSFEAAVTGAAIHGLASQKWPKKSKDYLSMRPLDLIELLPETLYSLR
jgi:ADP-dependent NAD(P)H-hydrate dehydratase